MSGYGFYEDDDNSNADYGRGRFNKRDNGEVRSPKGRGNRQLPVYTTDNYECLPNKSGAIRLLNLLPSENIDAVPVCELIIMEDNRHNYIRYEALSWCWGTEGATERLHIQKMMQTRGRSYTEFVKYIPPNLSEALKALRLPTSYRMLWIDAICINQEDLEEKSLQVAMMNQIYGNAHRVCIWLGPRDKSSDIAIPFIRDELNDVENFDELCDSPKASPKWEAFLELMQRSWFTRRWVVQEIALARQALLHCGAEELTWEQFSMAVELFVQVETSTHRLSDAITSEAVRHRITQQVADKFGSVSALGASLLVDVTERLFIPFEDDTRNYGESRFRHDYSDTRFDNDDNSSASWLANKAKSHMRPLLSLEYLMSSLTTFETTVPHDSIYALLSIARDAMPSVQQDSTGMGLPPKLMKTISLLSSRKIFNVDYKLAYVDVCKDFVEFCIRHSLRTDRSRALDVICRPWAYDQATLNARRDEQRRKMDRLEVESRRKRRETESSASLAPTTTQRHNTHPVEVDIPLPSWIPQLSQAAFAMKHRVGSYEPEMSRKNADSLVGLPSPARGIYSAAGGLGVDMKTLRFRKRAYQGSSSSSSPSHFSMYVSGFVLDVVEHVEDVADNGQVPRAWAEHTIWRDAREPPPDAFWRTLVANRGANGEAPPKYWQLACAEAFRQRGRGSTLVDTTALMTLGKNSLVTQYCRRVQAATWNRALVTTESGRLGLVRKAVRPGDKICILYGCSVPVVLRKRRKSADENDREYQQDMNSLVNEIEQRFRQRRLRKDPLSLGEFVLNKNPVRVLTPEEGREYEEAIKAKWSTLTFCSSSYELLGDCYVHGMMDGEALETQTLRGFPARVFEIR